MIENGSQSVLYTCSYVPEEIILAAGLQPRRFLPEGRPADVYVHPNTCSYVKGVLGAAAEGAAAGAAGIVIANSCDAMRKLYDLWTRYLPTPAAFFLDLPKKDDADAIAFFASELRRLARWIEHELPGTSVSDNDLEKAIAVCNEVRLLMADVFRAQRSANNRVRGTEVFNLCLAGTEQSKTAFAAEVRHLLDGLAKEDGHRKQQRLLLTGSLINRPDLLAEIENAGGRVVVLDSCIGLRHYEGLVEEDAPDPMLALASRYLLKPACARMQDFEQRFQYLRGLAKQAEADGIVLSSFKFCDAFLYDVPLLSARFTELGIPFLWIEGDYTEADLEQTKTRIEAFLELNS